MRPQREDERPRDTTGPGWLVDEHGRNYRDEKGTRIYRRIEDRDAALDETYRLAPAVRILMDCSDRSAIASHVCTHAQALAELFWREAPQTPGLEVDTKFSEWCSKNFGRQLEASARGVLWGEVRALEVGSTTRTMALFASYAEQQRYERAAASLPPWLSSAEGDDEVFAENSLARVEEIVFRATGKRPEGQPMARPLSRRQWEKRAAEETRKARELAAKGEFAGMVETLAGVEGK